MRVPSDLRGRGLRLAGDEDLFRLFVECVVDYAIVMLDPAGHIATWNLGAERITGWRHDEIVGRHFSVFYPAEERAGRKPDHELEEADRVGRFEDEDWRVRKDGSRYWANVIITPLRDHLGALVGFAKITRDLTARREAEETARKLAAEEAALAEHERTERELKRAEEETRRIGQVQEQLLAVVGHDLRTPLSAISMALALVRRRGGLSPDHERMLERIRSSAMRMNTIVGDLLDFSRARRGLGIPVNKVAADLSAVCRRAVQELRQVYPDRSLELSLADDATLVGDAARLTQVVSNLLGNALQHGEGAPVRISVTGREDELELMVHNRGPPIPAAEIPLLFEPFRRGSSTRASRERSGSIGLGLFIVNEIVKAHGGTVEAKSSAGEGTTFTIRLPRCPIERARADTAGGTAHP